MESTIERQRSLHEELERLEQAISDRLLYHPRTIKDQLQLDHEVADFLELIQVRSHTLKALYDDVDGTRAKETAALGVSKQAATQPGAGLEGFYEQYAQIRDHHSRYPNERVEDLAAFYAINLPNPEDEISPDDKIARLFSGEEGYGRFFDLNKLHADFCNLKRNRPISYTRYLEVFDDFEAFPAAVKQDPTYGAYLSALLAYLVSFYRRAVPLDVHDSVLDAMNKDFDEALQQGKVALQAGANTERKEEEGIWCAICQKRYAKQTVYDGHLNSKKHKAGLAKQANATSTDATSGADDVSKLALARREFLIHKLAVKFSSIKQATRANVVRKQTLTDREWLQEQESAFQAPPTARPPPGANHDMHDDGRDDDEENGGGDKFYNPLKLPLGWDGKPIPFWLWRLHGLGVEYSCEICGNHTYAGRRAYDKHFNEARHLHGLRCLGIENGGLLYDQITQIQDAINLSKRIEEKQAEQRKKLDAAVEMEDESGNVMSEKVYKDLVAQGIL